jgi:hypothetical protein
MAISSQDQLVDALCNRNQLLVITRGSSTPRTTIAGAWFQSLDLTGMPGSGTLAGTSVTAGVVPTDATAGCPTINAFSGSNTGYVSAIDCGCTATVRFLLADMLFKAGPYNFNSSQALSGQPSYLGRMPGGDATGSQIWIECVTAFTGNLTVTITYTNQSGTGSRTATLATGTALTVGRMMQVPLQAGDTGVQKIESVVGSVATVGTFNVLVIRTLRQMRIGQSNDGAIVGPDQLMHQIFSDSALFVLTAYDGVAVGAWEMLVNVING